MKKQNISTTNEIWTIFGERLKTELERQGISLRQFADKAGLTLNTACRYAHSQRTPRATEILKAAEVLHVTSDYMLGLSDDPHKSAQPEPCNDTISRQAAIDAVYKCADIFAGDMPVMVVKADAYEALAQLPSAQLETHEERTETHACDLISRQAAIDALTRKMVSIPAAGEKDLMGDVNRIRAEDISVIRRLPSAQPEQTNSWCINSWCNNCKEYDTEKHSCPRFNRVIKQTLDEVYAHAETEAEARFHAERKGKWIHNDKIDFPQCSECGMWIDVMQQSGKMNYCPNCGARMEG